MPRYPSPARLPLIPCECGAGAAIYGRAGTGIGSGARWCAACPYLEPDAPLRRCLCGVGNLRYGLPGPNGRRPTAATAKWCFHCPDRPAEAKSIVDKHCECGKNTPTFTLPGEEMKRSSARWCCLCPGKPEHAVSTQRIKRCECGLRFPSLGLPDFTGNKADAGKWCSLCPSRPPEAIGLYTKHCECGRSGARFCLPGQPARWCGKCPDKPPDAVRSQTEKRCACGNGRPNFGYPWEGTKGGQWCAKCPTKPPEARDVTHKKCECGARVPSVGMPGDKNKDAKWCATCPTRPPGSVHLRRYKGPQLPKDVPPQGLEALYAPSTPGVHQQAQGGEVPGGGGGSGKRPAPSPSQEEERARAQRLKVYEAQAELAVGGLARMAEEVAQAADRLEKEELKLGLCHRRYTERARECQNVLLQQEEAASGAAEGPVGREGMREAHAKVSKALYRLMAKANGIQARLSSFEVAANEYANK